MNTLTLTDVQYEDCKRLILREGDASREVATLLCGLHTGERTRLLGAKVATFHDFEDACRHAHGQHLLPVFINNGDRQGEYPAQGNSLEHGVDSYGRLHLHQEGEPSADWFKPTHLDHRIDRIAIVGHDLVFYDRELPEREIPDFAASHAQAFGERTTNLLRRLRIGVVGCSGTGAPVIEQLARLGVGSLLLIDHDVVEQRNINRIINSTVNDAMAGRKKVEVLASAIQRMGLGTKVDQYAFDIYSPDMVRKLADCDVLFGCIDGHRGRYLLNRLATFYLIPYLDLGIRLDADQDSGDIIQVSGAVHYLQPHRGNLITRRAISMDRVAAEGEMIDDPENYQRLRKEGYIKGVTEQRPAVISLNMQFSSIAVTELLARLHPYRTESNAKYACRRDSLSHMETIFEPEADEPCEMWARDLGRGEVKPLLGMPALSEKDLL